MGHDLRKTHDSGSSTLFTMNLGDGSRGNENVRYKSDKKSCEGR